MCYHCQQAAEKFFKALLVDVGVTVPRTHNLEDLLGLLQPHFPALAKHRRGLVFLTRFAVDFRYPGFHARRSQATAASRHANQVRSAVRKALGLRPRLVRKKKS